MSPIVALLDGSDWVDASVEFVVLPEGVEIQAEYERYRHWYRTIFAPSVGKQPRIAYQEFKEWLLQEGARVPDDDELVVFNVYLAQE